MAASGNKGPFGSEYPAVGAFFFSLHPFTDNLKKKTHYLKIMCAFINRRAI